MATSALPGGIPKQNALAIIGAAVLLLVLVMIYGGKGSSVPPVHPNVTAFLGPLDKLSAPEQTALAKVLPACASEAAAGDRKALAARWMKAAGGDASTAQPLAALLARTGVK